MKLKSKLNLVLVLSVVLSMAVFVCLPKDAKAAPDTFTVNSVADTGDANGGDGICQTSTPGECTLRAAIEQANSNGNPSDQDIINFNISGTGLHTLQQIGPYYFIAQPVKIDGLTQPGSSANTAAWPAPLNGTLNIQIESSAHTGAVGAFIVASSNVTFNGLVTGGSPEMTFVVQANSNDITFTGNYIGLDSSGIVADYSGSGSGDPVISAASDNLTMGGSSPAQRNVIVGGNSLLVNSGNNMTLRGNYFGVGADGITTMPTVGEMNTASIDLDGDNIQVGGTTAGQGNTFEGNQAQASLDISATNSSVLGNRFSGNFAGLSIGDSSNLEVGDGTSAGRNMISGNDLTDGFGNGTYGSGILVSSNSGPVSIKGNYIGVSEDGTTAFGNGARGIAVVNDSQDITIGGTDIGDENIIANNALDGILVSDMAHVAILDNSIYNNGGLGINLVGASDDPDIPTPTPNDPLDVDTGPNDLLNKPKLLPPVVSGSDTDVSYRLDVPAGDYRVEFFTNTAYDPSGSGEGETYLASDVVTSLGAGPQLFNLTIPGNTHTNISATATKIDVSTGSGYSMTSEFSDVPSTDIDTAVTKSVVDQNTIPRDGTVQYQVTFTNNGLDALNLSDYVVDSGDPLNTALFSDIFPNNLTLDSVTGDVDCSTQNAANTFGTMFSAHINYTVASCSFTGGSPTLLSSGDSLNFTLNFSVSNRLDNVFSNYLLAIPLSSDSSYEDYQNAINDSDDLINVLGTTDNLATATTTQQQVDVGLVKTLTNPEDFGPNSSLNYSFEYTNHGPGILQLSAYNSFFTGPLIMDWVPPDLTPSDLGADGPIPGSHYLTSVGNSDMTCLWAGPGSLGSALGLTTNADYGFIICQYDTPNTVLDANQSFNFNINFSTNGSLDPDLRNYALAYSPNGGSVDSDFGSFGAPVNPTDNDFLDNLIANHSSGDPINNFSIASSPSDIGITANLVNPQDVSSGNTIFYDVTLHNKGPGSLYLSDFSTFSNTLLTGVFPAHDLDFVGSATSGITCVDAGPGSVGFIGTAGSDHTTHQLLICLYTSFGDVIAPGDSYTLRLQFTAKNTVSNSFNAYFISSPSSTDPDLADFMAGFFGASGDVLDTFTNDNYYRVAFGDTPPDSGGGGDPSPDPSGSNSGGNSSSSKSGLSSTGQNIMILVGIGLVLVTASAALVVYKKRSHTKA